MKRLIQITIFLFISLYSFGQNELIDTDTSPFDSNLVDQALKDQFQIAMTEIFSNVPLQDTVLTAWI